MNKIDYRPWELYPHLWKTEALFWAYLRGALRRGVWEKSPIKLDFKNKNCLPPPDGYTGKAKSGNYCALSGQWEGKSKLQVDHIEGDMSLRCWEDILPFVMHLVPPPDNMQLVTPEAHKVKSYAEHEGISYEEAVLVKKAIAWEKVNKGVAKQRKALEKLGVSNTSSLKGKEIREAYIAYLKSIN